MKGLKENIHIPCKNIWINYLKNIYWNKFDSRSNKNNANSRNNWSYTILGE